MKTVPARHVPALLALLAVPLLHAAVPTAVAIKDAHVVTISGADLPKATVLLRNGLIEDVGPNVTVPAGTWIIDGSGLTVYPGFIDALSTWGIPGAVPPTAGRTTGAAATPAQTTPAPAQALTQSNAQSPAEAEDAGRPNIHGPEDRPQTYSFERAADLITPGDSRLEAARAVGFTSAATFPNRGIVEGLGAVIDLSGERGREMVVAQPVGQQILFRVGGGGMGRAFPASLMGNIAYIRQLYLDLNQYKEAKQIYAANPSGNKRPEYDHALEGLAEAPRILLPADQAQQIDRMISFGQELKTPFVLYGAHEAFKCLDEIKQANVPVLISLKWPVAERDANPEDIPNYRDLVIREQSPAVAGMFAKAGVKFAFYSDGVDSAPDLKRAIKKAIDAGLSRADAIRALTLTPAEIYGIGDRMGSIEKGKIANVVVMKGEAFDDKSTVEYVFVDGTMYKPSKELQQGPANGGPGGRRGAPTPTNDDNDGGH
ncbi:MAG TPA: amidohydrolase family protein [Bryobacteraceae bacterium]|nr:amidohydrolase family protein [Bryobacteraceae bacterium]